MQTRGKSVSEMGFIFGGGSETVHVYSTGAIGCTEAGDHGEVLRYKKKRSQLLFRYKKAVSTWKRSAIFLYFVFQYTHTLTHPKKHTSIFIQHGMLSSLKTSKRQRVIYC